jgi:hypothetical protein
MVVDSNVVKKLTDAKGLTSIFDDKAVKVKTITAANGPGCDSPFVNGAYVSKYTALRELTDALPPIGSIRGSAFRRKRVDTEQHRVICGVEGIILLRLGV